MCIDMCYNYNNINITHNITLSTTQYTGRHQPQLIPIHTDSLDSFSCFTHNILLKSTQEVPLTKKKIIIIRA